MENPELKIYSLESILAEKFHAMVSLGILNSRMNDFYDIWLMSTQYSFSAHDLKKAILLTFEQRGTQFPKLPLTIFSDDFLILKSEAWLSFLRKMNNNSCAEFNIVMDQIKTFILPLLEDGLSESRKFIWDYEMQRWF